MSKVVSQFKFKGAQVTITQRNKPLDATSWKFYSDVRKDLGVVSKLVRKYDFSNYDRSSALSVSYRTLKTGINSVSYKVKVTMNDISDDFNCDEWGKRERVFLIQTRHSLIRRLRKLKANKYGESIEYFLSPRDHLGLRCRVETNLFYYGSPLVGYVHAKSGDILRLHQQRISKRMFEPVKPMNKERHVGIEIECGIACSREDLAMKLNHLAGYVMIKNDGSVSVPNRNSVELNVCAPLSRYKTILKQVTNVLNDNHVDARVNKSCGLHVHLDIREFEGDYSKLREMYSKLVSVQGILYSMQPKSRQSNTYCVKVRSRSLSRGTSRYQGINAQSIWKYRTIETRLHAGTTDFHKIANWVDLISGVMYSNAITPKRSLSSVRSFFRTFNEVPTSLMEYVVERIRKFEDATVEENETAQAV